MRAVWWTLVLVALAGPSPAAAKVYHLSDGVVRVRSASASASVAERRPLLAMSEPVQPVDAAPPIAAQTAWDRAAASATLDQAALEAGLPSALLEALVWQESRWHPNAVSPKGAIGLTQLMPTTARELGVDPRDPTANLFGGARYLRSLLDHFDGDLVKALAAYNAGPRRVEQAGGIPPIAETQAYVVTILRRASATLARR